MHVVDILTALKIIYIAPVQIYSSRLN